MVSDLLIRGTNEWNRKRVEDTLPALAPIIFLIQPSRLNNEDSYGWQKTKSGSYEVKCGHTLQFRASWISKILNPFPSFSPKRRVLLHYLLPDYLLISSPDTTLLAIWGAREWQQAQPRILATTCPSLSLSPPPAEAPPNTISCNSDASWSPVSSKAALALREAMTAATQYPFTNVWFRSDSQELIRAIDSKIYLVELYGKYPFENVFTSLIKLFYFFCLSFSVAFMKY
ncbi:BnaC07g48480D, partial [Brassica napus]